MESASLYNVSSSPHVRSSLTTGNVMLDVCLALLPATLFGVWHFGFHAALVILMSIASAVLTEYVFDFITGRENTLKDGSAVVTGLLLALCLPPSVPLYIPYIGAVFAVLVVKNLFGGLGKNFMNPALGGRVFLLLSFGGAMTRYAVDGVSSATPLDTLASGGAANAVQMWTGHAGGVIGCSTAALLIGGLFLWAADGITWHIPVSTLLSFAAFLALFGGEFMTPGMILAQIGGGGIVMAAFFMATDPVTCPVTAPGQIVYGICVGTLSGLFRLFGSSADSVSYAVILSNLLTPLIDEVIVPKPYGFRAGEGVSKPHWSKWLPAAACAVLGTVLVSGLVLGGVSSATRGIIEERRLAENIATYQAVLPEAVSFGFQDGASAAIEALDGGVYGTDFGNAYVNEAVEAKDASGGVIGYLISVTSADGRDGPITLCAGILPDGTLNGIAFTELNETPGIGMVVGEAAFMDQFVGLKADRLTLGAEVDAATGATISSTAVVNAVNAALDFYAAHIQAS